MKTTSIAAMHGVLVPIGAHYIRGTPRENTSGCDYSYPSNMLRQTGVVSDLPPTILKKSKSAGKSRAKNKCIVSHERECNGQKHNGAGSYDAQHTTRVQLFYPQINGSL
jgi:hypothetical protein